jgi:GT2 family glycosyltransferase
MRDDEGAAPRDQDAAPAGARARAGVLAVVVNYEGELCLEPTLAALLRQEPPPAEVLLVDNASTDGSLSLVRARFPGVGILSLGANRGPAAARNAGYEASRLDRILFIDNDVVLEPGCLAALSDALSEHPRAAVATPRILHAERPDTIQYDGGECHFMGLLALPNAGLPVRSAGAETREIDSMISACFLVDRRRLGPGAPFDPDFFIYLEDHDFGLRTRIAGHAMLSVPAALCLHGAGTAGLSLRETGRYTSMRVLCLIRNRWLVLLKDYSARTLVVLAPALLVYEAAQLVTALSKGWMAEWSRAFRFILDHSHEILRERRRVQDSRVVADRSLLSGGPLPFTDRLAGGRLERLGQRLLDAVLTVWWGLVRRFV